MPITRQRDVTGTSIRTYPQVKGKVRGLFGKHGLTPVQRAEENTVKPDGPEGCWVWTGRVDNKGYGRSSYQGRDSTLHRLVYEFVNNVRLAANILVRHKCDNPPCWNPDHLETGTVQDNSDDMVQRGRSNRGSKRPAAKLTEELAAQIRAEYGDGGVTQYQLAEKYGVKQPNISRLIHKKQWGHVD